MGDSLTVRLFVSVASSQRLKYIKETKRNGMVRRDME
jgi:hypothetical protein